MSADLAVLDAVGQGALVRAGDLRPVDLVEAALQRIEQHNPALNAVIIPLFDRAFAAVESVDASALFPGVPFLLKDALCHSAGDPYHFGMRALKDRGHVARADTFLASRFKAAGLALCGKANTPELAASSVTEPLAYGPTANPWDLARTPGGSSGGSAAAVAAGLVPIAHGNDMMGSIRIPASLCGVVGLKPSRARITLGPEFGEFAWQATSEFALTRTVRDAAALLDAISGPASGDPYEARPPAGSYAAAIDRETAGLRIGWTVEVPGSGRSVHTECRRAVESAVELLADMGHSVEESAPRALERPFVMPILDLMRVHLAREVARWSDRLGRPLGEGDIEPDTIEQAGMGRAVSGVEYVSMVEGMHAFGRALASWWDDYDLLVTPTVPDLPALRSDDGRVPPDERPTMEFNAPFNISGQPAISLPLHWAESGLPVGVQLVASQGREDLLLEVAARLEAARPWIERYPAGAARNGS